MYAEPSEDDYTRLAAAIALRETEPARAFEEFRAIADKGYAHALLHVGWAYDKGLGVGKNLSQAEACYRSAYEAGHPETKKQAAYSLGWLFLHQKNYAKAYEWLQIGADLDFPPAMFRLGQLYLKGVGADRQPEKAYRLFERAASQGHLPARRSMGFQLMQGRRGLFNRFSGLYLLLVSMKDMVRLVFRNPRDQRLWL